MAGHIFLSYSRKDKARAKQLADTFENIGWDVWWDREIPPGQSFDDVIEEALIDAACIVVLWSKHSVHSQWVRTEAAEGKRRRILIPIQIDELDALPLAFRRTQVAPLINWNGSTSSEDFKLIVSSMSPFLPKNNLGSHSTAPNTPVSSVTPAAPVTPVIKPVTPEKTPTRPKENKPNINTSKGFPYKSMFMLLAVVVIAFVVYKSMNMMPNNKATEADIRIAELEEKQRLLEEQLAEKQREDKTKFDKEKRMEQEKKLKELQEENQRLLDLAREKKAIEEARKRKAEADEKERIRLQEIEDAKNNPTQNPNGVMPSTGSHIVIAKPSLKVRTAPKKSGQRIGLIPYGEKIQVVGVASSKESVAGKLGYWVEIQYKQQRAYVFNAFLKVVEPSSPPIKQKYVVLANPSLTIRKTPEVTGDKVGKAKKGNVVEFISNASALQTLNGKQGYWFKIKYGSTTGYVFSAYLRKQ